MVDDSEGFSDRRQRVRLIVSRHAAYLFWERGVEQTTAEDIAAAAGMSIRTLWRYFWSKEGCVEPLLLEFVGGLVRWYRRWPADQCIEDFLERELRAFSMTQEALLDDLRALRIITLTMTQPQLRPPWLTVCGEAERGLLPLVAGRLRLPEDDLAVRLCTASMTAAFRVSIEELSGPVARGGQLDRSGAARQIAAAIRGSTNGRIGDPIEP
jgi:AcrR family transcriptional regulator